MNIMDNKNKSPLSTILKCLSIERRNRLCQERKSKVVIEQAGGLQSQSLSVRWSPGRMCVSTVPSLCLCSTRHETKLSSTGGMVTLIP